MRRVSNVFPWTGLLFFGMGLGRLDLRDRSVNNRVVLAALGIAVLAQLISYLLVSYLRAHPDDMDAETIRNEQ